MADIFQKCFDYQDADNIKRVGLYPYFHTLESKQAPEVIMEGKRRIMLGSNNYLGLTTHPDVMKAAKDAIDKYGTGCSGSRFLNGTLDEHIVLEEEIRDFVGKEDALVFSTGYGSNLGILSAIAGRHDYIICDKEDHASIYAGCQLSYAEMKRYNHNDMNDLEKVLKRLPGDSGKLIVVDGVFSMGGDYANLPEIVRLAKKYGARTMVDDAHALGISGEGGRGSAWHFGLQDEVDIFMGTFSKSLASLGGYVASSERVINYLKHNSRPFIFTASNPPSATAAALASLRVLKAHPELPLRVNELGDYCRKALRDRDVVIRDSEAPIIPIPSRDMTTTATINKMLYEEGVFVNCVFPPAVDPEDCLIRVSLMATLTETLIDEAADKIAKVFKKLGLLKNQQNKGDKV